MVARVRHEPDVLVVTFARDGEEPDTMFAKDGQQAWQFAISLIGKRLWLLSGDTLTVRRTEDAERLDLERAPHDESF